MTKIDLLEKIAHKMIIRSAIEVVFARIPRKWVHSCMYYGQHGKRMNWENPLLYDEKIHWLMANLYDESYGKYADKLAVREYVTECGLKDILIPMYGVYENAEQINYNALPNQFILISNHGSGEDYYELCYDKNNLDTDKVNCKLNKALKKEFYKEKYEYHYSSIPPKILCLELLRAQSGERLTDYKVHCSMGKAICILVCTNREKELKTDYYSIEWEPLDYTTPAHKSGCMTEKPKCLEQMVQIAEILSAPFPISRIDFYEIDGRLYFGEVTLSPAAGNCYYLNEKGQAELGKQSMLPSK